jgi:hypothetical protein
VGAVGGGHHALLGALCSRSLAAVRLPYPPGRPCMYHVAPQCPPITRLVSRRTQVLPDHRNRLNCAARHMRPPAAPDSDHERPRALHLAALAAPHSSCSSPRPSPSPRAFVAPAGCSLGSKRPLGSRGLPAGCLPPQRCCGRPAETSVSLPTAACLLGRCCSGRIAARVPFSPTALGAARRCWSCCLWRWVGVGTWWVTVVRFEWSTGLEFLTVSSIPSASFRCQLNRWR